MKVVETMKHCTICPPIDSKLKNFFMEERKRPKSFLIKIAGRYHSAGEEKT